MLAILNTDAEPNVGKNRQSLRDLSHPLRPLCQDLKRMLRGFRHLRPNCFNELTWNSILK